jgi:single-strand DNA-binding protein
MNNLRNKVSLIGRLGATPEITTSENGRTFARFSLAVNNSYKDKSGNWIDDTQWHNLQAWGTTADLIKKLLNKGQEIVVDGKIVNRSYETKNGEKRFSTNIEVNEFLIISSTKKEN